MRHIAIIGMSFCGSTLLGRVLGALPGVANIGESHWMKTPPLPNANPRMCSHCGSSCPVLTSHFMDEMRADSSDWYPRIARALGTELLVSSDKNFNLVQTLDPSLDLDVILLFRFPIDCWRSYCRNANLPPEAGPALHMTRYYWFWTNFHGHALFNFQNKGRFAVVNYDAFVSDPPKQLENLCGLLQLPFTDAALEYWKKPQHMLGGNNSISGALEANDLERLHIQPRKNLATHNEVLEYCRHPTVMHMHSHLDRIASSGELYRGL